MQDEAGRRQAADRKLKIGILNARSVLFGFYSARPRLVRIRLVPGYQVKSVVTMQLKGDSTFARREF